MGIKQVGPFLKWAGGKTRLIEEIRKIYPKELGRTFRKYAEPFAGSGAVLFDILSNYSLDEVYISDINRELINAYIKIRDDVQSLIGILSQMQEFYASYGEENRKTYYYEKRERFNFLKIYGKETDEIEKAALMIFLNRTCFNGLYRVNSKNLFNVPQGDYKNPRICDEKNLRAVSQALQNVCICCRDYRESESFIDSKTFAYFDPPYRPLNKTSSFRAYSQNKFGDQDHIELAEFVNVLSKKGARLAISNSDPKNNDENDDFFDRLYRDHKIFRVYASRMINSNPSRRGRISELLIANFRESENPAKGQL